MQVQVQVQGAGGAGFKVGLKKKKVNKNEKNALMWAVLAKNPIYLIYFHFHLIFDPENTVKLLKRYFFF